MNQKQIEERISQDFNLAHTSLSHNLHNFFRSTTSGKLPDKVRIAKRRAKIQSVAMPSWTTDEPRLKLTDLSIRPTEGNVVVPFALLD